MPSTLSILGYSNSDSNKIEITSFFKKYSFNRIQIFLISSLITILFLISLGQLHQGQEFIYFQF